ncbi:hypothetical protein T484DRAFT_1556985, partial [Baffinella frigidus]
HLYTRSKTLIRALQHVCTSEVPSERNVPVRQRHQERVARPIVLPTPRVPARYNTCTRSLKHLYPLSKTLVPALYNACTRSLQHLYPLSTTLVSSLKHL